MVKVMGYDPKLASKGKAFMCTFMPKILHLLVI